MRDCLTCELEEGLGPNRHWHIPAALCIVAIAAGVHWAGEHSTIVEQPAPTPLTCKAQFIYIISGATEPPQRIQWWWIWEGLWSADCEKAFRWSL